MYTFIYTPSDQGSDLGAGYIQSLRWSRLRLSTPQSGLIQPTILFSPRRSHCWISLMMFTLFDSLTEPLSHSHSLLSYFLLFLFFPSLLSLLSLSLCLSCCLTFLTSLLLLQLFLAGSCVQWLSLPHKQKTLRQEWLEYRFIPQSCDFFFGNSRSPSKKCLYSGSLEAFQSLMCCNRESSRASKDSSKKWSSSIKHTAQKDIFFRCCFFSW